MSHSKEFFDFIRGIGESKSKQEEDKIVVKEIATLKTHFATPKLQLRFLSLSLQIFLSTNEKKTLNQCHSLKFLQNIC